MGTRTTSFTITNVYKSGVIGGQNTHYENMFVQYAAISKRGKNEKKIDIFLNFAQIIDCGHTLARRF